MPLHLRQQCIIIVLVALLAGCEKNSPVAPQSNQYEDRVSGEWTLSHSTTMVAENPLGPIIVQGGTDTTVR